MHLHNKVNFNVEQTLSQYNIRGEGEGILGHFYLEDLFYIALIM